jgi:hypothetical protein
MRIESLLDRSIERLPGTSAEEKTAAPDSLG